MDTPALAAPDTTQPATPETAIPESGAPATPAKNERMYTVKMPDGREEKWPESKIVERAQKSIGLEKRVTDADKYEKAFSNFVAKVQDPKELVGLLAHPDFKYDEEKQSALVTAMLESGNPKIVDSIKRWLYNKEVKPSLMDPKERAAMEWQEKAERLEREKQERLEGEKAKEEEGKVAQIKEAYRQELSKAYIESGLPVDDMLARRVLEKAQLFLKVGKHPDFKKCCELVQSEFMGQIKAILGKATVENILNYLDEETPQKINKALLAAVERKQKDGTLPKGAAPAPSGNKPNRREKEKSPEERKRWLRNLERGIVD